MRTLAALAILMLAPLLTVVILFFGTLASDEAVEKKVADSRASSAQIYEEGKLPPPENERQKK